MLNQLHDSTFINEKKYPNIRKNIPETFMRDLFLHMKKNFDDDFNFKSIQEMYDQQIIFDDCEYTNPNMLCIPIRVIDTIEENRKEEIRHSRKVFNSSFIILKVKLFPYFRNSKN